MSKIQLTGNVSGTGTITLESPNTNTDSTIIFPSTGGTMLTTTTTGLNANNITVGVLAVANGGTGSNTATFSGANITSLDASNISTGTLAVARGGTGAATLTAEAVIIGNTTSAVKFVSPGTTGNVLTSNGTVWASTAPAAPSAPSTAQVLTANSGATAGAVGTYALLRNGNNTTLAAGDTVSGSMDFANCGGSWSGSASGTWRCMGWTEGGAGNSRITTVFLRIS
jgi:hypothetical protein